MIRKTMHLVVPELVTYNEGVLLFATYYHRTWLEASQIDW